MGPTCVGADEAWPRRVKTNAARNRKRWASRWRIRTNEGRLGGRGREGEKVNEWDGGPAPGNETTAAC